MEQVALVGLKVLILFFIYIICIVRLLTKELKKYFLWMREDGKKFKFILSLIIVCIFAPIIICVYIIFNITWKLLDFLLK